MHVAEQRALPAAKAVPGHRYGNRHVDADHADLDAAGKFARHVAVAGVAGHAIAEFVIVDQLDCGGKVVDAHAGQYRTKNFFLVDAHFRRDMVEQRAAHPETLVASWASRRALEAAAIH